MRRDFLPFSPPHIGEAEIDEVVDTLRSSWISTGPKVRRFEQDFAAFVGAPSALAVNSGTAALHVALTALGIGPGDQVVTTPMTFCSSVHVIEHVGARPLLVDVEGDTLNIDPARVEAAIVSARNGNKDSPIRAILPVHLYGHPCEMNQLRAIASEHDIHIVEDAAHALPAAYGNRMIGAGSPAEGQERPALAAFSFYATKNLTTTEGGMLVGPTELLDTARVLSLHGMDRDAYQRYSSHGSWHYEVVSPGFKYNMTDVQAAIGIHQLRRLLEGHQRRRQIAGRYNDAFADFAELQAPTARADVDHAWHVYALRLNLQRLSIDRARFIEELRTLNIGASVHFIPIHLHSYYRHKYHYEPAEFPIALREYRRLVSLPLNVTMTNGDVEDVIEAVTTVVHRSRK